MGQKSCSLVIAGLGLALSLVACGPSQTGVGGDDDDDGMDVDARGNNNGSDGGIIVGSDGGTVIDDCQALRATVRDFTPATHEDFEPDTASDVSYPGLVRNMLGADNKPVYAPSGSTSHTAGPAQFAQWYNDTPGINQPFEVILALTQQSSGRYVFDDSTFFPIDGMGYGNSGLANDGQQHNFHFTTEIHTTFKYMGGEVFNFNGDDDLWLFINGRLAIDLGGLHPALPGMVNLDASASTLGIERNHVYSMDIFHAERHTDASNFHVETTIDCFIVP